MKESLEKWLLFVVPFLLAISICYNNGYWSPYPINIYEYYQVSDILKGIAMPSFRFISLALLPLLVSISIIIQSLKADAPARTKEEENKIDAAVKKKTEETDKQTGLNKGHRYRWLNYLLAGVMAGVGMLLVFTPIVLASVFLSPYLDEEKFIKIYFTALSSSIARGVMACFLVPLFIGFVVLLQQDQHNPPKNSPASKVALLMSMLLTTLTLAYQSGRIDAYKIISGYDFYYLLDNKDVPHKYLGKLDKYFFFLDDIRIIDPKGTMDMRVDTMTYSAVISIVSDDSLKSLPLVHYNTFSTVIPEAAKIFQSRNPVDVKKK